MICCLQALKDHSTLQDDRTEKQIVSLLTSLLTAHEPVTVLGLSTYPEVMSLLKADAQKVSLRLLVKTYWSPISCMVLPAHRWYWARALQKVTVCVPSQSMAVKIVETILKVNTEISDPAQVETLLDFVKPLIADIPGVEVDEEVCPHSPMQSSFGPQHRVLGGLKQHHPLICAVFDHTVEMVEIRGHHAGFPGRTGSCCKTHP